MLNVCPDALVCDLAETYGVLDYRALPGRLLATLAAGLREDSRAKLALCGAKATQQSLLLAAAVDKLSLLVWMQTKDAQRGRRRPASVLDALLGEENQKEVASYNSAEEFEAARAAVLRGN